MLKDGDMILLYHEKHHFMIPYQPNSSFSTHKGMVKLPPGLNFGDRLEGHSGEIFHILRPSLSDWMMKVRRNTNIVYPKDAGVIILEMGIQSGSRIIEIGSGSGSLTILLSRILGPQGKLHTFERKEENLERTRKNLRRLGCFDNIEYHLGDPCENPDGFNLDNMDGIFIDVPAPWTLVEQAYEALAPGAHLGSLSPCIEQVQQMSEQLKHSGFSRIRVSEILERNIRVKPNMTRPFDRMIAHTAYLLFAQKITKE